LPDGTPYYGRLGEIAYDADEDRVQCHLCGQWFRWIGGTDLARTHDWTIEEYREAFHLLQRTSTAAHGFSEQRREQLKQRVDAGELVPLGPDRPPTPRERVAGPQRMPHWRSLAARRADLAAQLHPARNGELSAQQFAMHSTTSLWWQCGRCGHAWRATPKDRRHQPPGWCPECAGPEGRPPRVSRARSLAARPDLLAELHPTLNPGVDLTRIAAKSHKKALVAVPDVRPQLADDPGGSSRRLGLPSLRPGGQPADGARRGNRPLTGDQAPGYRRRAAPDTQSGDRSQKAGRPVRSEAVVALP